MRPYDKHVVRRTELWFRACSNSGANADKAVDKRRSMFNAVRPSAHTVISAERFRALGTVASMPEAKNQSEDEELRGVIAAVDQPEFECALGELIVDAKAGGGDAESGRHARL